MAVVRPMIQYVSEHIATIPGEARPPRRRMLTTTMLHMRRKPANFPRGYCGCIATVAVLTEVVSLGVASVASTALLKVPLPPPRSRSSLTSPVSTVLPRVDGVVLLEFSNSS